MICPRNLPGSPASRIFRPSSVSRSDATRWGGQNVFDVYTTFEGTALDESKWEIPPDAPRKGGWWMRKAVSLAINRTLIERVISRGQGVVSQGLKPPEQGPGLDQVPQAGQLEHQDFVRIHKAPRSTASMVCTRWR